jgi:large subunit ribosomal protein L23
MVSESLYRILKRPLVTEKGYKLRQENNVYTFEVDRKATKSEIKKAVEELFSVQVLDVHTVLVRGKLKRWRMQVGKRRNWKKAYVKIAPGQSIPILEGK